MGHPRRQTDSDEDDFRTARRGGPLNGHTKWIVTTVGALLVTALVALASRDRESIDKEQGVQNGRLSSVELAVVNLAATQASAQATTQAFREEVLRSLAEIKADVKEVKRNVR